MKKSKIKAACPVMGNAYSKYIRTLWMLERTFFDEVKLLRDTAEFNSWYNSPKVTVW